MSESSSKPEPSRGIVSASALALGDQMLVSGNRFLIAVLVGRFAGASELGWFSMGLTFVILFGCVLEALVTMPYTVMSGGLSSLARRRHFSRALVLAAGLCSTAAIVLLGTAMVLPRIETAAAYASLFVALAFAAPAWMMHEFIRRVQFARMRFGRALLIDSIYSALLYAGLIWLTLSGQLAAESTLVLVGFVNLLVAGGWLLTEAISCPANRRETHRRVAHSARQHWQLGRWALGTQVNGHLNGYAIPWIVGVMLGAHEAGLFFASMYIVALANPLILGMSNYLMPGLALRVTKESKQQVRRFVMRTGVVLVLTVSCGAMVVALFSAQLPALLFGSEFGGSGLVLLLLLGALLLRCINLPAHNAVLAYRHPHLTYVSSLIGLIVTVGLAVLLIDRFHSAGAALAVLAGTFAGVCVDAYWFRRLTDSRAATIAAGGKPVPA